MMKILIAEDDRELRRMFAHVLIKNGYMTDPKSGWDGNYDILVDGEKIARIAKSPDNTPKKFIGL